MPLYSAARARRGFTIIEIIVVVIIIALMLIIIVPHLFNESKVRKAEQERNDLVALNSAVEHYALDNGKVGGAEVQYGEIRKYLDPKSYVYRSGGTDVFGNAYGPFTVGSPPAVPADAAQKLEGVEGADFWSPFQ
jgi:prepilin-type N-terminal cleavage/methylation domain-containing protein